MVAIIKNSYYCKFYGTTYNIRSNNPKHLKDQYRTSNSNAIPIMKFINMKVPMHNYIEIFHPHLLIWYAFNKIILSYDTTSAEVHDSKGFEGLLDEKDEGKDLYLDAGYVGQEEIVKQHKMNPIICEKGYRNRPLTKEQKSDNRKKSKTRCLVEHVFGFEEQTMRGLVVRTVGLIRAKANVALTSLVYNISRYTQIIRLKPELLG